MRVKVKLYAWFREYLPDAPRGEAWVELPMGATVGDLLASLRIFGQVESVSVNAVTEPDPARVLHPGDSVSVYPIVFGG